MIGSTEDTVPVDNRISAFLDRQGIPTATGAAIFGSRNFLTLSTRPFPQGPDLLIGAKADQNVVLLQSASRMIDESPPGANYLLGIPPTKLAPRQ